MPNYQTKDTQGPLSGVKVIDLTRTLAGNICTMILADSGAETIKVQEPSKGGLGHTDPLKAVDPYNRNKKSITLNLHADKGKDILRRLMQWGDVLVENYRPGFMKRIGFDYPAVRQINPHLIMTSISGYGQTGPYAHRRAYDAVGQAMGGLMSVTGPADSPPMAAGVALADIGSGVFGAVGTLLALYHQQSTGLGQHVESSLVESIVFFMGLNLSLYASGEDVAKGSLFSPGRTPGAGMFHTKDGAYIVIMAHTDQHWPLMARIIGREDLATAPDYKIRAERSKHGNEIWDLIQAWVSSQAIDEVEAIIDKAGIPFGRVQTLADLLKDPHLKARGRFHQVDFYGKKLPLMAPYPILSDTPGSIRTPWPRLGEHNEEVYCGLLGFSQEQLAAIKNDGVI